LPASQRLSAPSEAANEKSQPPVGRNSAQRKPESRVANQNDSTGTGSANETGRKPRTGAAVVEATSLGGDTGELTSPNEKSRGHEEDLQEILLDESSILAYDWIFI